MSGSTTRRGCGCQATPWPISAPGDGALRVGSRFDGVALLAEALSDAHPTGRFRELLRVFERAFTLGPHASIDPLAQFLTYFSRLEYSSDEVAYWMDDLRHKATHADRREDFVLARDIGPALARVEFAAYDVLLNKRYWRTKDSERRHEWQPRAGVLRDGKSVVIRQHAADFSQYTTLLDGFGSYPKNLMTAFDPPERADIWWRARQSFKRGGLSMLIHPSLRHEDDSDA